MMNSGASQRKSSLECDVGLGLKMQLPPTHESSAHSCDSGGICEASYDAVLPRNYHNTVLTAAGMGAEVESGGGKAAGGSFFTETQWEELERQKMIHKYLLASVPVPPQLLCYGTASSCNLPFPKTQAAGATTTTLAHASQSNTSLISGMDMRYSTLSSSSSGGSMDAEPWRCKRTDGKKWRCSRDVAPDLKYCERHAHKTRGPRSRKPVEQHHQSHNSNITTTHSQQHHLKTGTTTPQQHLQMPTSQFQTLPTPTSYDQTRNMEWFMRGGSSSVTSNQQQQWQQLMQTSSSSSSSGLGLNRDNTDDNNKNVPSSYQYEVDKQGFMGFFNPFISVGHQKMDNSPILDPKFASLQSGPSLNADGKIQTTTRHFIDAWGKESLAPVSSSKRFSPSSSLSLSMNGINEDNNYDNGYLGVGMMDSDRDSSSDGIMKSQWLNNPVSYGGPLGEALCLGNASTTRGGGLNSSLASPAHGYSINSSNTNSSGCSKSSCEDGSHALNFIG